MHNLLRDLGRGIAESSTLRLRLWKKPQSIDELLQNSLYGLVNVRGLRLVDGDIDPVLPTKIPWYKRLSYELFHSKNTIELQLLDTKGDLLKLLLKSVHLPNLVWLRWSKCPEYSLSSWVPMKNLRVLHVSGSVLETLWPDEAPLLLQAPLLLRELVIVAPLSRLPKSIGQLKYLELIVLSYRMSNLERLPDEFCLLQSLKHFELTNCSKIKSLPDSFGDLKNLQHIDLSHSYYLKTLPESFSDLVQLKHLDLSYCYNLTMSSEALGNIRTLEYIDISYCTKIETLPPQVARQLSLQNLYFSGTHFKELPVTIGDMRDLEFLVLECCFLEMLPYSVGNLTNLKELTLRHCNALKRLPDSVGLLNRVIVYDCGLLQLSLEKVEGEAEILRQSKGKGLMSNLDSSIDRYMPRLPLRINSETENLRQSKGKRMLSNPDTSIYRHMPRLPPRINREIPEVSFPGLQHLLVESCDDLVEVGTLPNTLIALQLKRCCNLRKIEGLGTLAELQILDISQCTELEELPSIETLLSLGELYACGCVKLKSIRGFAQLEKLGVLDVSECSELEELQGVEHLSSLVMLKATQCPKLQWDEQLPLRSIFLLRESSIQASSWSWRSRQVMCKALLLIRFICNSHVWPWRSRLVMCMAILWHIN
jgi:Leucine-rich repeat (LRR) protein